MMRFETLVVIGGLCAGSVAQAANLVVTTAADSGAGSLRDALITANGNDEDDTITFDASLAGATIQLTSNDAAGSAAYGPTALFVSEGGRSVTISWNPEDGAAPALEGQNARRVFAIAANASLHLSYVTVQNGRALGFNGGDSFGGGGGGGAAGLGGGVFIDIGGTLTAVGCVFTGNRALGGDGGFGGVGFNDDGAGGGGLAAVGQSAPGVNGGAGGGPNGGGTPSGAGGFGGGGGGGDLIGASPGGVGGFGGGGGGGGVGTGAVLGGFGGYGTFGGGGGGGGGEGFLGPGPGPGGDNRANRGSAGGVGGIGFSEGAGGGGGAGMGGAVFNHQGSLVSLNSTFVGNQSMTGSGGGGGVGATPGTAAFSDGGAVFSLNGTTRLVSCTLAGNQGDDFGSSVAIYADGNFGTGTATLEVNNTAVGDDAGFASFDIEAIAVNGGAFVGSGAGNVFETASGLTGVTFAAADPGFATALADNGGSISTLALTAGAPTSTETCFELDGTTVLSVDQRGVVRPAMGCDAGAYQRAVACTAMAQCAAGGCNDGWCCLCPGGTSDDCTTCAANLGAARDGLCVALAVDAACGDDTNSTCDGADTCDGTGMCLANVADDGIPCDDGAFCSGSSSCVSGVCEGEDDSPCSANQTCNEAMGLCIDDCGNGIVDEREACDDGERNSDTEADACRSDCSPPVCGDGVIDSGEECDDRSMNGDAGSRCRADCTRVKGGRTSNGCGCTTQSGGGFGKGVWVLMALLWLRRLSPRRRLQGARGATCVALCPT